MWLFGIGGKWKSETKKVFNFIKHHEVLIDNNGACD